jgi:hypothetical protein
MTHIIQTRAGVLFRIGDAIQVLFDVLSAYAGRGELAGEDGLANTAVLLLQANPSLRKYMCLFFCIQICSSVKQFWGLEQGT